MKVPLRVLVAVGVVVLVTIAAVAWAGRASTKPALLPPGKVQPQFSGSLLLAPDGTLWRTYFETTRGKTTLTYLPFAPGDDWAQVSGSGYEAAAIKEDGTLWSWRTVGGTRPKLSPPAQVGSDSDWSSVSHALGRAILLKRDGTLWFMGNTRADGKIGAVGLDPHPPEQIGTDRDWIAAKTSGSVQWALKRDGTMWRWGWLSDRYDRPQIPPQPNPVLVSPETDWRSIDVNHGLLAAMKPDGSIWLQGYYSHLAAPGHIPVQKRLTLSRADARSQWREVIPGRHCIFAKNADGSWWASGMNEYSCLGLPRLFGTESRIHHLTRIPMDLNIWAMNPSGGSTLILSRDGGIYYMGAAPGAKCCPPETSNLGSAILKNLYHRASQRVAGSISMENPLYTWSQKPVRIGELPPSVIESLKRDR